MKVFGRITNLCKAFDCIPYDLLGAKLEAFFLKGCIETCFDYLSNRKKKVNINEAFSSLKDIGYGVSQGLILGLLFFNSPDIASWIALQDIL